MDVTTFFNLLVTIMSVVGVIIIAVAKIYTNFFLKLTRTIGKGKLLEILTFINELTDKMSIDDARELIIQFYKKRMTEIDMKQLSVDVSKILDFKNIIQKPAISKMLADYQRKQQMSNIKSIKRWEQFRKTIEADKAIDAILTIINEKRKLQTDITKEKVKPELDHIKTIFDNANKLIPFNREKRMKLDKLRREVEERKNNENLDKIKERLHDIFNETKK